MKIYMGDSRIMTGMQANSSMEHFKPERKLWKYTYQALFYVLIFLLGFYWGQTSQIVIKTAMGGT